MRSAFDELAALGVGVQLTPGNEPTVGFAEHVKAGAVPVRTHHGFSFKAHRLLRSPHVDEVHVSMNDGRHDSHRPLRADAFGLAWARERARDGVPLIYEAHLHRAGDEARRAQLDLVHEAFS